MKKKNSADLLCICQLRNKNIEIYCAASISRIEPQTIHSGQEKIGIWHGHFNKIRFQKKTLTRSNQSRPLCKPGR